MPPQERSLATVTYLMSLSEMARTPFSLVDEINQVSETCLRQTPRPRNRDDQSQSGDVQMIVQMVSLILTSRAWTSARSVTSTISLSR
jgi:hypothetical protein